MIEMSINSISIKGEYIFEFRDTKEKYKILYGSKMMAVYYPETGVIVDGRAIKCEEAFILIDKRISTISCLFRAKDFGDKRFFHEGRELVANEPYACDSRDALNVVKLLHEIRTTERSARSRIKRGDGRIPALERLATETIEEGVDRRMQKHERAWRKRMDAISIPASELPPEIVEHGKCRDLFEAIKKDEEIWPRFDLYRKMRPLLASKERRDDARKKIDEIFEDEERETFDRLIKHPTVCLGMTHHPNYFVIGEYVELPEESGVEKPVDPVFSDERYSIYMNLVERMRDKEITQEEAKSFLEEQNYSIAEVKMYVEKFVESKKLEQKGETND